MADSGYRERRNSRGQFVQGSTGNAFGRPRGSRNKLGEQFVHDLFASWREHGERALERCAEETPAAYVKVVASLCPRDVCLNTSAADGLTDEEIEFGLQAIRAALAARYTFRSRAPRVERRE